MGTHHRQHRRRSVLLRLSALFAVAALMLAACGGDDDDSNAAQPTDDSTTTSAAPADDGSSGAPDIASFSTELGVILVDGTRRTVYVFANDTAGTSTCVDACADAWPPLTIDGDEPVIDTGLDDAMFGTITRDDGTTQVTVNDMPLYFYGGDTAAGNTNGQGVGGIWHVVGEDGQKIEGTGGSDSTTDSTEGSDTSGDSSGMGY